MPFAKISFENRPLELEYSFILPDNTGPLIVFLHEGLGSLQMWRSFPQMLCAASGCRGLVYSRGGYGSSSSIWPGQWPIEFMHVEARSVLPQLFQALGIDTQQHPPILFGHSDGASIALIFACLYPQQVSKLILAAPHIFVEDLTISSIAQTKKRSMETDLLERLGKYHQEVAMMFSGWIGVWLNPDFRNWNIEGYLVELRCPTLIVQGYDDQYGTMHQVDGIVAIAPHAQVLRLRDCGHSPHVDQPAASIRAASDFIAQTGVV